MDNQYAPIHRNAQAILREKTLLGETYVQLTEGSPNAPSVPDGGRLSNGQVIPAVQLDQIFNTFDPTTRDAFRTWQQELAKAVKGNDQNLNDVLGNLPTFAVNLTPAAPGARRRAQRGGLAVAQRRHHVQRAERAIRRRFAT